MEYNRRRKREYIYAGLVVVVYSALIYGSLLRSCLQGGRHEKRRFS